MPQSENRSAGLRAPFRPSAHVTRAAIRDHHRAFWLSRLVFIGMALALASLGGGRAQGPERLNLEEARVYLLELINADRAAMGLAPVRMDPVAGAAAQRHADEMAAHRFLSHWDRDGKLPDQRYTEVGGTGFVQENVYLAARALPESAPEPLLLDANPTFTRFELQEIQAAYFNQRPPYDNHRRNICGPRHTHVGIGLAKGLLGGQVISISNAQEFVAHYLELAGLPREAPVGARITLTGRAINGAVVHAIELARSPLPRPLGRAELSEMGGYGLARTYQTLPAGPEKDRSVSVNPDGTFRAEVILSDDGQPGIYYVRIKVRAADRQPFLASQRTIVARSGSSAPASTSLRASRAYGAVTAVHAVRRFQQEEMQ